MTKPTGPTDKPADALTAIPPEGIVLGSGRLRVTPQDLDLYAALVGVPQTLLLSEAPAVPPPPPRFGFRADRAGLSLWVQGLSRRAKQQIRQAKARLTSPGRTPRA
jgi:hypothetical protein